MAMPMMDAAAADASNKLSGLLAALFLHQKKIIDDISSRQSPQEKANPIVNVAFRVALPIFRTRKYTRGGYEIECGISR